MRYKLWVLIDILICGSQGEADTNLWVLVDVLIDGSQGEAEVFLANNLLPVLLLLLPVLVVQLVEQLPGDDHTNMIIVNMFEK